MKNRSSKIITIVLAIVVVLIVGAYLIYKSVGPKVLAFTIEQPSLIATGKKLSNVEVWAIQNNEGKEVAVKLGAMELQEADANGNQTWTMEVPEKPSAEVTKLVARGYASSFRVGTLELPAATPADLNAEVWPSKSVEGITGGIKSITGKKMEFGMDVPVGGMLNVTLADNVKITDSRGRPAAVSLLKPRTRIAIIGEFTDDIEFMATAIEILAK
ncbi:MAG: hypothetical protein V4519_02375 [Patescibacteria group bacterium]